MSIGDFPESLSQAMLVGTMLVGRLGVCLCIRVCTCSLPACVWTVENCRSSQRYAELINNNNNMFVPYFIILQPKLIMCNGSSSIVIISIIIILLCLRCPLCMGAHSSEGAPNCGAIGHSNNENDK